ncbi:MAG: flagellar motor protein MotB [Alphaproteobacteria bacterium]|nr:flagellar motor protein MotB [Alphaproteobacteria bacterium]
MKRFRRRRIRPLDHHVPSDLMSLSLFIMLLAFFIVLNAISSFEEKKAKPVMESVERTFSKQAIQTDVKPSPVPSPEKSIREGETTERLDALFNAQISDFKVQKTTPALPGVMTVVLPLDAFSSAIMTLGQEDLSRASLLPKDQVFFLPTLVSILKTDRQKTPYRMDMVFHLKGNPAWVQNQAPEKIRPLMNQASVISEKIQAAGMPEKLLSIGIEQGAEDTVTLYFRPHVPFTLESTASPKVQP